MTLYNDQIKVNEIDRSKYYNSTGYLLGLDYCKFNFEENCF